MEDSDVERPLIESRDQALEVLMSMMVFDNPYTDRDATWVTMIECFDHLGVPRAEVMEAQLRRIRSRYEEQREVMEQEIEASR